MRETFGRRWGDCKLLQNFAQTEAKKNGDVVFNGDDVFGEEFEKYLTYLLRKTKTSLKEWARIFNWIEDEDEFGNVKEERRLWLEQWKANEDNARVKNITRLRNRIQQVSLLGGCVGVVIVAFCLNITNFP